MKKPKESPGFSEYILPLRMNGLSGRMLVLPPKNGQPPKREILFISGVHTSIERFEGISRFMSRYGRVTMPDLPGFGGMEPFYKLKVEPSIDAYADYLASFVKFRYRNKKICIIGMSFGFVVVTRMLQRYPELQNKVTVLVSVVGIADKSNYKLKKRTLSSLVLFGHFLERKTPSILIRSIFMRHAVLGRFYTSSHPKMKDFTPEQRREITEFETHLWRINELRTYASVMMQLAALRHPELTIDLELHHVETPDDQLLDHDQVMVDLKRIYSKKIHVHTAHMTSHGASLLADEDEAAELIPSSLRTILD